MDMKMLIRNIFLDSQSSSTSSEDDKPKPTGPSVVTRHRSGHITRVSSMFLNTSICQINDCLLYLI